MSLPNFLCIGTQKSGTTLLYEQLKKIDDIYLPKVKELHFFDEQNNFSKGIDWYKQNYFQDTQAKKAVGEITPSYIYIEDVANKIYLSLNKNIKFIVILRNPIQRAYSHYIMRYKRGEEEYSFKDAMILESVRISKSREYKRKYSYLQRGLYAKQLTNYLNYYDSKQFLFLEFDDFIQNQDKSIEQICNFLNVEKTVQINNTKVHSSELSLKEKINFQLLNKNYNFFSLFRKNGYTAMDAHAKLLLKKYYRDDILALEKIIKKDLSTWLQ